MHISVLLFSLCLCASFVVGLICGVHVSEAENLTKEEYAHAVQLVLSDTGKSRDDIQRLLTEVQEFAMNSKQRLEHLSNEARNVVNTVINK